MSHNSRSRRPQNARKRPVQQRSRATVATILEAAAHVLERRGQAGFTTNHVAERAGVSIGSIYQYFRDKDALLAALLTQVIEQTEHAMLAELSGLRAREVSNEAWAGALVRVWCSTHAEAHHALLYALSATLPGIRERGERAIATLSSEVALQLRRRAVPSPALRARVIMLTGLGLVHELVIGLQGPARRAAERETVRIIAAYLESVTPTRAARARGPTPGARRR